MYSTNPNGRPNSWAPHDEHSRARVPGIWPQDDRYRARDDQMMPHHNPERAPIVPSDMPLHPQAQQPDHMYHSMSQPAHMDHYAIQQPMFHQQPAPRQRTAIACRYCRRRKIRCSGFDSSPDGRCSNCLRFSQECVFTPVSSQTHAFVPAHTQYPHLKQGYTRADNRAYGQLYGPHGQPINIAMLPPHQQSEYMHPGYGPRPPSPGLSNPPSYPRGYDPASFDHSRDRDYHHQPLPPLSQAGAYGPPHVPQRRGSAGDYSAPSGWRDMPGHPQGHPPSPPTTLPLPQPFPPTASLRPTTNGVYTNGAYPQDAPPQPATGRGPYSVSEGHYYSNSLGSSHLPVTASTPRRSSDPREKDVRDPRYAADPVPFHTSPNPAANSVIKTEFKAESPSAPRSSSAGPSSISNPMNLQNLISDPGSIASGSSRSTTDSKMLSSLSWKP